MMSKFSPFNRFKKIAKRISKNTGISLSQVQEQEARSAGYSCFHDLQICAKRNSQDSRLVEYVFGADGFDGNEILAREMLRIDLDGILMNELAGEIALTNAFDFYLDVMEVDYEYYCDDSGVLSLKGTATLTGEADEDRPFAGSQVYAYISVDLFYCDKQREWSLHDLSKNAVKIQSVSNDFEEAEMY